MDPVYDRQKLAEIYAMADAGCVPSVFPEGFGLVSLEMQACGLPVLATDAGGLKETYIDGQTGFYVKQNDSRDLAEKIRTVILNTDLRSQMAKNARQYTVQNCSWEVTADKLIRIYEAVLNHE